MNWSDYKEDIRELKFRLKAWGISFLCATLFFLAAPASLNSNFLSFYKPFVSLLLDAIRARVLPSSVQLIAGTAGAPIEIYTFASIFFGFLVTTPILFYEVYAFVSPAFDSFPHRIIWISYALFSVGCLFGFFILLPSIILGLFAFFPYVGVTANFITVKDFYGMVFWTVLVSGFCFLSPVVVFVAAKYLNFDPKVVTSKRKYLWAVTYVVSAWVTPDSNILADFVLFIPIIIMIELSLFFVKRTKREKA